MGNELTTAEKMRRIPWHYAGSALNSVFCIWTVFGTVFTLFLREVGLDNTRIGFVLSLLPFMGVLALVFGPYIPRFGFKRTFVLFYGLRKPVAALLILTPLMVSRWGANVAFWWVVAVVLVFGICRSIAETASYPWYQGFIPDRVRGKVTSISTILSTIAMVCGLGIASYVVGHYTGLWRFAVLMGFGVFAGVAAVWCYSHLPEDGEHQSEQQRNASVATMLDACRDVNFRRFLFGVGLVSVGFVPLISFIPLYMKEKIGIDAGYVVLLGVALHVGIMATSYLWGWASDRYGSKPVMQSGLGIIISLPILWFLVPRHSVWSLVAAMAIAVVFGIGQMAWGVGSGRYLFVNAVPRDKSASYMAVFYAWVGLTAGAAPLLAGRFLDMCQGISGRFWIFTIDQYTPLFLTSVVFMILAGVVLTRARGDGEMPTGKFVGMFLQGNAISAMGSLVRYRFAGEERERVSTTEQLGSAKNPLSINELVEAVTDPSFNVRFEAIISIAKMRPDPKLVDELLLVLGGSNPDLSVTAAWALGKLGDKSAVLPLRETLMSDYPLLRARSARALAMLGDSDSIPFLLGEFQKEEDEGVKLAYASALGLLHSGEAEEHLLRFLRGADDVTTRDELALSLARVIVQEGRYIKFRRNWRTDAGTECAQWLHALEKIAKLRYPGDTELLEAFGRCSKAFGNDDLAGGSSLLAELLSKLPRDGMSDSVVMVLEECTTCLREFGQKRPEYIWLAVTAVGGVWHDKKNRDGKKHG